MATTNESASLLRLPALSAITGVGRSATYEAIRAGTMVKPIKISARAIGFPSQEVAALVAARAAGATEDQIKDLVNRLLAERTERLPAILKPATLAKG